MASMGMFLVLLGVFSLVGAVHGSRVSQDDSNNWSYSGDSFALSSEGSVVTTSGSGFDMVETPDDQSNVGQFNENSFAQRIHDNSHQFEANTFPDDDQVIGAQGDPSASYDSLSSHELLDSPNDEGGKLVGEDDNLSFANTDFSPLDTFDSSTDSYAASSEGGKLVSTTFTLDPPTGSGSSFDYSKLDNVNDPSAREGVSYALGNSEERNPAPTGGNAEYVYDARAGGQGNGDQAAESFSTVGVDPNATESTTSAKGHEGPSSVYTPSSDTEPFNFHDPRTPEEQRVSSVVDNSPDTSASFAASTDTTTASTSPLFATSNPTKGTHGCPSSYWVDHREKWPREITVSTLFKDVCGDGENAKLKIVEIVFGTTKFYQALLDTRAAPYSQLLRQTAGAVLNSLTKPAFPIRVEEVCKQFKAALLAGKSTSKAQAQKFENENKAYGPNECA
ncbi:uncharacterized protein [Physcomitrium patens]|uniref:Uncharacterized protein n=1 Tax=Physcomitrium patens TaxID=3218 RepID=A0A2K1KQP3_PHYPA|nr:uncharacterized protein LOC112281711 [Physcomitrium patens]PNR56076.1 hypothetical protein PHYPA_006973 [Physcomitrium patens]|eukprot:XP_024374303.1 uncharacterized protein LOC112281711 [Physcomitrella patens]